MPEPWTADDVQDYWASVATARPALAAATMRAPEGRRPVRLCRACGSLTHGSCPCPDHTPTTAERDEDEARWIASRGEQP